MKKEKTTIVALVPSDCLIAEVFCYLSEKLTRSPNYVTLEGAVFHNMFYYQQLSFARYQVSFYDNSYFE